jgi:hypothetical protein
MRSAVVALFVFWAGVSCGGAPARPPTWQSVAVQRWLELRSDSFVMWTDLPRSTALERFREIEQIRDVLLDHFALIAPGPAPVVTPFHHVHLENCAGLVAKKDRPGWQASFGFVGESLDWSDTRLVVTCENTERRSSLVVHEMTHVLTASYFAHLPRWLVEGLSEYYETLRVDDASVIIGIPPPEYTQRLVSAAPEFAALTSMSANFYDEKMYFNYAGAWKLVHLLSSPEHRGRFIAYLRALHAGGTGADAWRASFGDVGDDRIAAQYHSYGKRLGFRVYERPHVPRKGHRPPAVRNLRTGEAHAVWLRIYMAGSEYMFRTVFREAWRAHLAAMVREDPQWTGVQFWRALDTHRYGGFIGPAQAERLLRAYVEREPGDARAWSWLVSFGLDRLIVEDKVGIDDQAPAGLVDLEPDVRALLRFGDSPMALNRIGWYYALRRLPNIGLAFAFRSVRGSPTCGECFDTLALLLYQSGRLAEAVAAQERAVALLSEGGVPSGVTRRLEELRRARDQAASSR